MSNLVSILKKLCKNPIVVHRIPKLRPNIKLALKEWDKFFRNNAHRYDILWSNQNGLTHLEFLKLAKKYGIKKRIDHRSTVQLLINFIVLFILLIGFLLGNMQQIFGRADWRQLIIFIMVRKEEKH